MNILTFDCYGTLLNMAPRDQALCSIRQKYGIPVTDDVFLTEYNRQERLAMQAPEFHPLRIIMQQALSETLHHFDIMQADQDAPSLIAAYRELQPYPEVNTVLGELAHNARIYLLSNANRDTLTLNCKSFHFPIAGSFIAEDLHCYKPDLAFFQHVSEALKLVHHTHTHIAAGFDCDIAPTAQLQWNRIWVNRQHTPGDDRYQPYRDIQNLTELL
jgi:2-haloacid dehalogenase